MLTHFAVHEKAEMPYGTFLVTVSLSMKYPPPPPPTYPGHGLGDVGGFSPPYQQLRTVHHQAAVVVVFQAAVDSDGVCQDTSSSAVQGVL